MTRVAVLTSVHPMQDVRIFRKECRSLASAGYDVTLVVPDNGTEPVNGIRLIRLPRPSRRLVRMTKTVGQVWRVAARLHAHVYHFHDPELIPVGLLLRLGGRHVIYDIHEDVPRQLRSKRYIPTWLRAPLCWFIEAIENAAARRFTALVAATPDIAARFARLNRTTVIVQNFPLAGDLASMSPRQWESRGRCVAYVGGITFERGVREMVAAMELLDPSLDAWLDLAGEFSHSRDRDTMAKAPGWARVKEHGMLSHGRVAELLGRVRAGLVLLYPEPNHLRALPTKMFEYMFAGIPVIASNFPLWREIIEGARCGIVVDPLDPKAIAQAIEYILTHAPEAEEMGRRGREAVKTRFNWSNEERSLLSLYERLAPATRPE